MSITDDPRVINALKREVHEMAHDWAFDIAHGDGGTAAEKAHPAALDAGVDSEIRKSWFAVYGETFDKIYDEEYRAVARVQLARLLSEIDKPHFTLSLADALLSVLAKQLLNYTTDPRRAAEHYANDLRDRIDELIAIVAAGKQTGR